MCIPSLPTLSVAVAWCLHAGDRFRAGKVIDDMVYIEVEGSDDNPFIVSAEQLTLHSDYPLLVEDEEDDLAAGH